MTIRPERLDELLQGYENPEDFLGKGGILKQLTAALVERCLNAEMKPHLDEQRPEPTREDASAGNHRNGHSKKTIKGEFEPAEIAPIPPLKKLAPKKSIVIRLCSGTLSDALSELVRQGVRQMIAQPVLE